jgi:hypothetical protein
MKTTSRLLIAFLALSLLLSACVVGGRNALIGKWSEASSGTVMEFTADGKLRFFQQNATIEIPFQFLDDHTIIIKASPVTSTEDTNAPFKVSGDTLSMELGGAEPTTFTRVK